MSAAQSQERVLEYTYLTLGGVDPDSGKEYSAKWAMQYSLLVSKDQGHLQMAVISLESQKPSLGLIDSLERKGISGLLGIKQGLSLSQLFGGFFNSQQMGVVAGRSMRGAFLNAVTSQKQQLQANYQGPEQKKPSISQILTGGGGQQSQQQTPMI